MPKLEEYLEFAESLAKDAGEIARKHFAHDIAFESKDDNSPVTVADLAINDLVIKRCREQYPEIGIIGEEASDHDGNGKLVWVCDPIDGTIPYSLGMGISTFCLALVQDGEPVVGVVYNFAHDRLFSAIKGGPARLNGVPIQKSDKTPMKLVGLEWWGGSMFKLEGLHKRLFDKGYQAPNYASSGYMGTLVALGRIAGVIYSGNSPWDVAATKVIVEACGGKVTSLHGAEQRYDQTITGAIIAHPEHLNPILQTVQETLAHAK